MVGSLDRPGTTKDGKRLKALPALSEILAVEWTELKVEARCRC
jgi:hypothetical protein